jgi:peptidoglycan/LPS O-acetylase OafA/YrhL
VVLLAYLLSLGVASIVYVVLEKPAVLWGRRLAGVYVGRNQRRQRKIREAGDQTPEYTVALRR